MHVFQVPEDRWSFLHAMRGQLIAQARASGLTAEEAEDVASEAILRAARQQDLDLERAAGWLRVVARRLAVDVFRQRPSPRLLERLDGHAAHAVHPQEAVDDRLEAQWVAGIVRALPARQRFVLEERAAEARFEDIADRLGTPYKTVESLASRGRATVRRALASTLGLTAALATGLRRSARPAAGVLVASALPAGAIAATVALSPAGPAHDTSATRLPVRLTVESVDKTPRPAPVRVRRATAPASSSYALPRPHPREAVSALPAGRIGPVQHGGVSADRTRGDETLTQTAVRCLREGPSVSLSWVGCR